MVAKICSLADKVDLNHPKSCLASFCHSLLYIFFSFIDWVINRHDLSSFPPINLTATKLVLLDSLYEQYVYVVALVQIVTPVSVLSFVKIVFLDEFGMLFTLMSFHIDQSELV